MSEPQQKSKYLVEVSFIDTVESNFYEAEAIEQDHEKITIFHDQSDNNLQSTIFKTTVREIRISKN